MCVRLMASKQLCPCGSGRKKKNCCAHARGDSAAQTIRDGGPSVAGVVLPGVLALSFVIFSGSLVFFKVWEPDVWLHLSVGRFIARYGVVPTTNTFSFTEPSAPWVGHEWLYQRLSYGLYTVLGPGGLIALRISLFLATLGFLFRAVHRRGWEVLTFGGLAAIASVMSIRFNDRPEMFSAVFIALYFYLLDDWRQRGGRKIWTIVLLQALWSNMHGYFLIGLVLLVVFCLGELLSRRWREARSLAIVGLASFAACLLTPHFFRGLWATVGSAFTLTQGNISEFAPAFSSFGEFWSADWLETEKWIIWVPLASMALNHKRTPATYWLLWASLLGMFLKSQRNILFYAVIAAPITLENIRQVLEANAWMIRLDHLRRLNITLQVILTGLMLGGMFDALTGRNFRRKGHFLEPGSGLSALFAPAAACDYIEQAGLKGPFFNSYLTGNYLLWRFPERPVFVDGRGFEAYSRGFMSFYRDVSGNRISVAELRRTYPVNFFFLSPFRDSSVLPLIGALSRDPAWKAVYVDHAAVIFAPATLKLALTIKSPSPDVDEYGRWGRVWEHYNLGATLMLIGRQEEAMAHLHAAYRLEPDFLPAQ